MARNLELLNNIAMVSNEAKINFYTAKYRKKRINNGLLFY